MSPKNKSLLLTFARLGLESNPSHADADAIRKLIAWTEGGVTGNWDNVPRKPKAVKAPAAPVEEGMPVTAPKAKAPKAPKAPKTAKREAKGGRLVTTASADAVAAALSE